MLYVLAAGLVLARLGSGGWEYLLLQSNYGDKHWSPPKTNLESGEELQAGVYRALQERTGLDKSDVQLLSDFQHDVSYTYKDSSNQDVNKTVKYTLAKYTGTKGDSVKLGGKHQAFQWQVLNTAKTSVGYQNMKDLLDQAEAKLKAAS